MHGGAKGSGGPPGERNGRYTEGRFTKAAKQAARERRRAVRVATAMVRHFVDVIEGREEETPAFAAQWEAEGAVGNSNVPGGQSCRLRQTCPGALPVTAFAAQWEADGAAAIRSLREAGLGGR